MASIDESGRAKGAAALAAGVEKFGAGIKSFGSSMEAVDNANSQFEVTKADSQWAVAKLDAAAGLKSPAGGTSGAAGTGGATTAAPADADPFYPSAPAEDTAVPDAGPQAAVAPPQDTGGAADGSPAPYAITPSGGANGAQAPVQSVTGNPAYDAQVDAAVKKNDEIAAGIGNPRARELWKLKAADDIARLRIAGQKAAQSVDRDAHLDYARQNQDAIISRAIESDNEKDRADAIHSQMQLVDSYTGRYLTQQQATAWKNGFKNKYAESFALASERKGPDAVNKTISDLENSALNAANAPQKQQQTPVQPVGPVTIQDKSSDAGFGDRFGRLQEGNVKGMIIHHTGGGGDVNGVINTFQQRNFPAQFVIDRDGKVYQTLPDGARGQQIKNGWGKGEGLSNANTEGVEIIAKNDADVLPVQRDAAIALVQQRAAKWGYDPKTGVFGHGEVNPGHKEADEGMTVVNAIRGGAAPTIAATADPFGNDKARIARGTDQPVKMASLSDGQTATDASPEQAGAAVAVAGDQPAPPTQVAQAQRKPTIYDAMDPLKREELLKKMYGVRKTMGLDEERALELEKKKAAAASDLREQQYLTDIYGDNPQMTIKDVVNDPALTREAKERIPGIMNRADKPDPMSVVSHTNSMNLLGRMRLPDGDPNKLTSLEPIYDSYINEGLNRTDLEFLKKQFLEARTPDGESLSTKKAEFTKSIKPLIDKSNPLMGVIDESGSQQLYLFNYDMDRKIEQYRKEGKNPHDLFDPSKPDFMGKPDSIAPYQKTLQQSLADRARSLSAPTPGTGSRIPGAAAPEPRKPGESPADYLKRTGKL